MAASLTSCGKNMASSAGIVIKLLGSWVVGRVVGWAVGLRGSITLRCGESFCSSDIQVGVVHAFIFPSDIPNLIMRFRVMTCLIISYNLC